MQVYLTAVYIAFGLSKMVGVAWWDGSAAWMLLARTETQAINLTWMYAYFPLVELWTHLIVATQLAYPVLVWRRGSRPVMQVFCAIMWLSIIPLTGQWSMVLAMLTANLVLVSTSIGHRFWKLLPGMNQQSLDSICPPCETVELSSVTDSPAGGKGKDESARLQPQLTGE